MVTAALVTAALTAAVACGCAADPAGPTHAGGGRSTSPFDAHTPRLSAARLITTAPGPVGLVADTQGRVWVANADDGSASRLDAAGTHVDLTRHVDDAPLRLAATRSAIWVTVFGDGSLERLDPASGHIAQTVRVGSQPEGLTAAYGSLWVVLQTSGQLIRVDPYDGKVTNRYAVGVAPRLVVSGLGALSTTARLALRGAPDAVTAGPAGHVLVALQEGPSLAVVDPRGPSVVRLARLGSQDQLHDRANIDVVYADGRVFVSSYLEGGVYRLRP